MVFNVPGSIRKVSPASSGSTDCNVHMRWDKYKRIRGVVVQQRASDVSGHRTARVLVYTHRWLGIAAGLLFIVWFLSGIVMMYARMPALDPIERLARLPALNPAFVRVSPPAADGNASGLSLSSLEGRPVYRLSAGGRTRFVFADTGDDVPPVDAEQAMRVARAFTGGHVTRPIRCAPRRLGSVDLRRAPADAPAPAHRRGRGGDAAVRHRERRRRGDEVDRLRPSMGMARRGAALDLLHVAQAKRRSLERGHRLVVAGRNGDVPVWARVGRLAAVALSRLPAARSPAAIAVRRVDALASLPWADLRLHHDDVRLQRHALDGSLGLAPRHGPDARSTRAVGGRSARDRRSPGRRGAARPRGVRAADAQGDRRGAISRALLRERG